MWITARVEGEDRYVFLADSGVIAIVTTRKKPFDKGLWWTAGDSYARDEWLGNPPTFRAAVQAAENYINNNNLN